MMRILKAFSLVLAIALPLSACGIKSQPERPEGSDFPRDYPVMPDKKKPQASLTEHIVRS